jgi:HEAT repeat protein
VESASTGSNGVLVLVAGPIPEPDKLAAKLTFGRVVHPARGVINVAADAERIPKEPELPAGADAITRSLAELHLHDQHTRRQAIQRLARQRVDPKRQAEVARALEGKLPERDVFTRKEAIKALAIWGDSESVPALMTMLGHDDVFTRHEAIQALARIRDERAIEPITERLVELADRMAAKEALQDFGKAAEPAVLKLLQHPDLFVRNEACKVLKAIGTQASIPALRQVVRAGGLPAIAAREALQAIGLDR